MVPNCRQDSRLLGAIFTDSVLYSVNTKSAMIIFSFFSREEESVVFHTYSVHKKNGNIFFRVNNFFSIQLKVMKRHTLKPKHVFSKNVRFHNVWMCNMHLSND